MSAFTASILPWVSLRSATAFYPPGSGPDRLRRVGFIIVRFRFIQIIDHHLLVTNDLRVKPAANWPIRHRLSTTLPYLNGFRAM